VLPIFQLRLNSHLLPKACLVLVLLCHWVEPFCLPVSARFKPSTYTFIFHPGHLFSVVFSRDAPLVHFLTFFPTPLVPRVAFGKGSPFFDNCEKLPHQLLPSLTGFLVLALTSQSPRVPVQL